MTFPTVAGVGRGDSGGDVTTETVTFDSSPNAGDLVIVMVATDSSSSVLTWPTGYTEFGGLPTAVGSMQMNIRYRECDGSEGASFDLSISPSNAISWQVYRITGHLAATAPTGSTPAGGLSANPDPPTSSPGVSEDILYLVCTTVNDGDVTISGYPTNYTDGIRDGSGGAGGVVVGSARRNLNATSDDPGTFTLSSSSFGWLAYTIGVRPGAAAAEVFFENRHPIEHGMKPQTAAGMGGVIIES